jgi:hypothetical protein
MLKDAPWKSETEEGRREERGETQERLCCITARFAMDSPSFPTMCFLYGSNLKRERIGALDII